MKPFPASSPFFRRSVALALGFGWVLFWLSPLLRTGYDMDDVYNSQVTGTLILSDRSIWEFTATELLGWLKGAGRLMPLAFYSYPLFHFLDSLLAYKTLMVAVIAADVALFAFFLRRLTRSWEAAWVFLLVMPIFFQFRNWFDPFFGFAFHVPLVSLLLIGASLTFDRYLENSRRPWLAGSLVLHACALLMYEVSYLAIFLFLALAYYRRDAIKNLGGKIGNKIFAHLVLWALIVGTAVALKTPLNPYFADTYPNASLHGNALKIYRTFLVQAYASIPWSYGLAILGQKTEEGMKASSLHYIGLFDGVILLGLFLGLFQGLRGVGKIRDIPYRFLATWGAFLALGPAVIMGVSGYQDLLMNTGYGWGYLAVFLQYFGTCLVFLGMIFFGLNRIPRQWAKSWGAGLVAGLFTLLALYNLNLNRAVAAIRNQTHLYPREVLETSFKMGLLDEIGSDGVLLRKELFPHDNIWNYAKWAGKKINVQEPEVYLASLKKGELPKKVFALGYSFDAELGRHGVVYLGEVDRYAMEKNVIRTIGLRRLKAYDFSSRTVREIGIPEGKLFEFKHFLDRPDELAQNSQVLEVGRYLIERRF